MRKKFSWIWCDRNYDVKSAKFPKLSAQFWRFLCLFMVPYWNSDDICANWNSPPQNVLNSLWFDIFTFIIPSLESDYLCVFGSVRKFTVLSKPKFVIFFLFRLVFVYIKKVFHHVLGWYRQLVMHQINRFLLTNRSIIVDINKNIVSPNPITEENKTSISLTKHW